MEFHRNRDRYMRKHHGRGLRGLSGSCGSGATWSALSPRWSSPATRAPLLVHARQELRPHGQGVREAAEAHNRRIGS